MTLSEMKVILEAVRWAKLNIIGQSPRLKESEEILVKEIKRQTTNYVTGERTSTPEKETN